jgi:hypothetical protein
VNTIDMTPQREPDERDQFPQSAEPAALAHTEKETSPGLRGGPLRSAIDATPGLFDNVTSNAKDDVPRRSGNDRASRSDGANSFDPPTSSAKEQVDRAAASAPPPGSSARESPPQEKLAPSSAIKSAVSGATIDTEFIADLGSRMAKSELAELGWRDRHDLADVMRDLELLSGASWKMAASLWDKYRPGDPDKPIFIDGDDKDPPTPADDSPNLGTRPAALVKKIDTRDSMDPKGVEVGLVPPTLPQSLAKRYLVAENRFYFRDDPNLVAFEDMGKRLSTEHNDPMVARSMVELAHAKNWESLRVKGTDEFKREVWLAASLRGLDVEGYQPRAIDVTRLAELRGEFQPKPRNSIEQGLDREKKPTELPVTGFSTNEALSLSTGKPDDSAEGYRALTKQQRVAVDSMRAILTERGDSAKAIAMAVDLASERFQQQRVYVGKMLDHGRAPYENKPDEKMNYFVTLKTMNGERTMWGVDLERVVTAGAIETGDDIALVYRGRKRVTVLANERDDAGKLTGKQVNTEVNRNTWEVEKLSKMRDEALARVHGAALQIDVNQPIVPVYDIPPVRRIDAPEPGKARGPDKPLAR